MPEDRRRALRTMATSSGPSNPPHLKVTRAVLTVQSGPEAGRVVPLPAGDVTTLGRAEECTLSFDETRLSRTHATIHCSAGVWLLTDEGSTNGTYVNDVRVERYSALMDGSRIVLGGAVTLRFTLVTAEEERSLNRLYDAAMRDGLTGVYNRKALDERLASEWAFAARHHASLCVVLLDLDGFKAINDRHGHLAGDAVLREAARRMGRDVRAEDVLGRYGGEEFMVVARDIDLGDAAQLAERLRQRLAAEPVVHEGATIGVSASFGVASMACCGQDLQLRTLLAIADARLYAAKRAGRNRVVAASG